MASQILVLIILVELVAIIVICALWGSTRKYLKSSQYERRVQEGYKDDYFEKYCKSTGRISELERELRLTKDELQFARSSLLEVRGALNKVLGVKSFTVEESPKTGE